MVFLTWQEIMAIHVISDGPKFFEVLDAYTIYDEAGQPVEIESDVFDVEDVQGDVGFS